MLVYARRLHDSDFQILILFVTYTIHCSEMNIPSKKHKRQCGETGRRDCQALVQQEPCGPRYIRKFKKLNKRVTRGKKNCQYPKLCSFKGGTVQELAKKTPQHTSITSKNITNTYGRGEGSWEGEVSQLRHREADAANRRITALTAYCAATGEGEAEEAEEADFKNGL